MTSPYLERPRRSIEDVLAKKKMTKADIGLSDDSADLSDIQPATESPIRRRARGLLWVVAVIALGVSAIGTFRVVTTVNDDNRIAEDAIDDLQTIAPAAGNNNASD